MSKKKQAGFFGDNFWQSDNYNRRTVAMHLDMLLGLAMNRFRWVGLPDTCDARFFELQLHKNGIATICHPDNMPDVWQTLIAQPMGEFNEYGIPTRWRAAGYNQTNYDVSPGNGELCYYSNSRVQPWNYLSIFARKLTHYSRTEDINLFHQHTPAIFIAPQNKKIEITNLLMQHSGYEPVVIGDNSLSELANSVTKIDFDVPMITEELARCYQNTLNQCLMFLGIPHLAFEKGERMIEDEARANSAPTTIALLDCLQARRDFCQKMRRLSPDVFGELDVFFNDDFESYNFNYINNIESIAQDTGEVMGVENNEL